MSVEQKVVVVGGGPVGALAALYAAQRGYEVELYDLRDDPNFGDLSARPAIALIPLALSERGIRAIEAAGVPKLIQQLIDDSRPIHTRMIHDHDRDGHIKLHPMPYGPNGEILHTLPREKVAKYLLLALRKQPTAKLFFNQKLVSCDLKRKTVQFESINWMSNYAAEAKPTDDRDVQDTSVKNSAMTRTVSFGFLFGCDGAYSNIRQSMMREMDMDYEVSYIHAKWCDLIIPPGTNGDYRMDSHNLHVWPDKDSIVMAQPDFDGSFRAGMVVDEDICKSLEEHPEEIDSRFRSRYPGIVPDLLSADELKRQFLNHQHISLKSIKCGNFGYKDTAILLGDSSHSMTPFHAMGMISGLEDVRVFFEEFLDPAHAKASHAAGSSKQDAQLFCPPGVVRQYTEHRKPDVQAMTDMAAEHYHELRINSRSLLQRSVKRVQSLLQKHLPALGFATLYWRIQFSHERFSTIQKREKQQKKALKLLLQGFGWLVGCSMLAVAWTLPY